MRGIGSLLRPLVALTFALLAIPLVAQATYPIEGYIDAVHPPGGFEVNGRQFVVTSNTSFGSMGSESTSIKNPLRTKLRIGAYVQVAGADPGPFKPLIATTVLIRDDWDSKQSGIGVITRVVSPAPDAIYEADGYLIHITPSTRLSFVGSLDSLADVSENTWLHFSGKRGQDGVVEAAKAQFIPGKPTSFKAVRNVEVPTVKSRPAGAQDAALTSKATGTPTIPSGGEGLQQDEELKIGPGRWHTIPADQPLQERVHRIGTALVPAYQRAMAEDNPSKIHFRFFAIDNNRLRGAICLLDGAILVSRETVERISSDDQLAAVIADGIACNLQRQTARTIMNVRRDLGIEIALDVAEGFVPGIGLGKLALMRNDYDTMAEERLRIALALMQEAGYDPWQAPEAWRLLEHKKVPANLASLPYPDTSCYQFSILNLQYVRR